MSTAPAVPAHLSGWRGGTRGGRWPLRPRNPEKSDRFIQFTCAHCGKRARALIEGGAAAGEEHEVPCCMCNSVNRVRVRKAMFG